MNEWSLGMNIIFIGLFTIVIGIYFRFLIQTIWYLLKKRPSNALHKWKKRFPLWEHFRLYPSRYKWTYPISILVIFLLPVIWIQTGGETHYSFFYIFTLFAALVITREFTIHYTLTDSFLHVWSVHYDAYPIKNGEKRYYRYVIEKAHIQRVEEVFRGFHIYIEKDTYVYVAAQGDIKQALRSWLKNTR